MEMSLNTIRIPRDCEGSMEDDIFQVKAVNDKVRPGHLVHRLNRHHEHTCGRVYHGPIDLFDSVSESHSDHWNDKLYDPQPRAAPSFG